MDEVQTSRTIKMGDMGNKLLNSARIGHAKHRLHLCQRNFVAGVGNGLIEQAESVAHTAGGGPRNQFCGSTLQFHMFLFGDKVQMLDNLACGDTFEIEALATREDGGQHFMHIGRRHAQR